MAYSGWNVYDYQTRQPITSGGYSTGGGTTFGGTSSWDRPNTPVLTPSRKGGGLGGAYFGAGQGGSSRGDGSRMNAGTMFGGNDQMDMEDYLKLAGWQQAVNQATRGSVLGYYDPLSTELGGLSSYYQPRLREQPYNESSIGMIQGQARDTLNAQRNAQLRQLQDMMARRGGAVGYGAMNELEARYGKQLGDIMRDVRIQAIDKNRAALQSALQSEAGLAAQKQTLAQAQAQAWYNLPAAQELPKLGQRATQQQNFYPGEAYVGSRLSGKGWNEL